LLRISWAGTALVVLEARVMGAVLAGLRRVSRRCSGSARRRTWAGARAPVDGSESWQATEQLGVRVGFKTLDQAGLVGGDLLAERLDEWYERGDGHPVGVVGRRRRG
jgi:hypothetical protein